MLHSIVGDRAAKSLVVDRDLLLSQWQRKTKAASLAFFALHPHSPLMALNNLLADRQTQPKMVALARRAVVRPVEALEDLRLLFRADAQAGVPDLQQRLVAAVMALGVSLAAGRAGARGG